MRQFIDENSKALYKQIWQDVFQIKSLLEYNLKLGTRPPRLTKLFSWSHVIHSPQLQQKLTVSLQCNVIWGHIREVEKKYLLIISIVAKKALTITTYQRSMKTSFVLFFYIEYIPFLTLCYILVLLFCNHCSTDQLLSLHLSQSVSPIADYSLTQFSNYSLSPIINWTKQYWLVIHQEFLTFLQKNLTWQVASQMQQLTALCSRNKTENWQRSFFWWVIFNQVKSLT